MLLKASTNCTRELLRTVGTDKKEQIAGAMHKLKAAVHEVVSPAWLVEAENAPGRSQSQTFHGHKEEKTEPEGQRSDKNNSREVNASFSVRFGAYKRTF